MSKRALTWAAIASFLALLALTVTSSILDGPLRRLLEGNINRRLTGYSVTLGGAHFNPFTLSLKLEQTIVRQQANPEPPVAALPVLRASIEWRRLLSLRLVANAKFEQPRIHVNLPQLQADRKDEVPLRERGWQQALESIFPLKFDLIEVADGELAYIDVDPEKPLLISHWRLQAENIRNIRSRDRVYPSVIHSDGVVFDSGRAELDGHADFLAQPYPGVQASYRVDGIPLDRLRPIIARANLELKGGVLSSQGAFEYGPRHREVAAQEMTIDGLRLDYIHTAATAGAEKARAQAVKAAVEQDTVPMRIAILHLTDAELGLQDRARDPGYRVFLDHADMRITNVSVGPEPATAEATLTGRFMGTGTAKASATVRTGGPAVDASASLAIEHAALPRLNDVLRSFGKFDVSSGTFSVFSEVSVKDKRIAGYVKPLFDGIKVYDSRQDSRKGVLRKAYEKLVGAAARLLRNRRSDAVATQTDISGSLDHPSTSVWETLGHLLSNAFVRAILPGFDREVSRLGQGAPSPRQGRLRGRPLRPVKPTAGP